MLFALLCIVFVHMSSFAQSRDAASASTLSAQQSVARKTSKSDSIAQAMRAKMLQRIELFGKRPDDNAQASLSGAKKASAPHKAPACEHDDDEDFYLYYDSGEEAYEDVTVYYPLTFYLFPEQLEDPNEYELEVMAKIANYPDYESVKAWVALREEYRKLYIPIMQAVEEGHAKGTLGPGEEDWRAIAHYNRLWQEVYFAYFDFEDAFDAEYERKEHYYYTYPWASDGENLRDKDLATKWYMYSTDEGRDYSDIMIGGHRDINLQGYALTVSNIDEDDLNFPRHWALYGSYTDESEASDADFDVSRMTLLDEKNDYSFYYLEEMRAEFAVSKPGIYNRFVLRVFNHKAELSYDSPITISTLEFIEDEVHPTPIIDYGSEPVIKSFQVLENSVKGFDDAFLRLRCADIASDGDFRLIGDGNIQVTFRSVDPDYADVPYAIVNGKKPALAFDEDGYLTIPLVRSNGLGLFNEWSDFPRVPGHVCDVIVRFRAVEKATGRIVNYEEAVPYDYHFIGPTIKGNDLELKSADEILSHMFTRTLTNLDFVNGFTITVKLTDYDHPADLPWILNYDYSPTAADIEARKTGGIAYDEVLSRESTYNCSLRQYTNWWQDGHEWGTSGECAVLYIPMSIGRQGANVTITATNKGNLGTETYSIPLSYTPLGNMEDKIQIFYSSGYTSPTDIRPISQWEGSNASELEALKAAFSAGNAQGIKKALLDFSDSNYKSFIVKAPDEWGKVELRVDYSFAEGTDKFYVRLPRVNTPETFTMEFSWPDINYTKRLDFTVHPFPNDEYYLFAPSIDGAVGEQSVTLYYDLAHEYGEKAERKAVTVTGQFGTDAEDPDYICIHEPGGLAPESFICLRDENSKRSTYVNKEYKTKYITAPSGETYKVRDYDTVQDVQIPVGWIHPNSIAVGTSPVSQIEGIRDNIRELHIDQRKAIQLQILDENGQDITSDISVRSAFIRIPETQGSVPYGTSPDFNPFTKGERLDVEIASVNGIFTLDLPQEEEGFVNEIFIEVADKLTSQGYIRYNDRVISRLTTPEAFTDYFDKGLPYPCVLRSRNHYLNVTDAWMRPKGSHVLSSERTSLALTNGSEIGYESGESCIDMLLCTEYNDGYEGSRTITLADGSISKAWETPDAEAVFAPELAYYDIKYNDDGTSIRAGRYFNQDFIDPLTLMRDDIGREIFWDSSHTGFEHSYKLLTFTPDAIIPRMTQQETEPHSADVVIGLFTRKGVDANGRPIDSDQGGDSHFNRCSIGRIYNNAVEEVSPEACVRDVASLVTPSYDGDAKPEEDETAKIDRGLRDFEFTSPSCLPFASLLVTSKEGEYRIRSSFEVNAMDFIMPQNEAMEQLDKIQKRVNDVATFTMQYMRVKNTCLGDYTTDIFNQDDGVFVGFKGFVEMAVLKDYKANEWKPYFTGFGAKLEASAQFSWQLQCTPLFAKMTTRAEVSSTFMLLNPDKKDFALQQAAYNPKENINLETFNPYSHFNIYLLSTFDLSLCLQAGIGFDAGFIAAHGGLMGRARAAANFAYVNRPYLGSGYSQSSGSRFDLSASLSAYAYFKFIFLKYTKEWPICHVEKTYYYPDSDWNPWKSDPNLKPEEIERNARMRVRPLTATYKPQRKRVSVIGSRSITDKVDIFANPIYLDGGKRLAFLHINNPADANDDRVLVSGADCNVDNASHIYGDDVPAFSFHAASAADNQIVAVQRLGQRIGSKASTMEDATSLTDQLQIVASVGSEGQLKPTVISSADVANQDPRAAIAPNGNAAAVWAAGKIGMEELSDGEGGTFANPTLTGNIVASTYDASTSSWSVPATIVASTPASQVKDYAIATGGKEPLVIASVPGKDVQGNATAPVILFSLREDGSVRSTSLGIQGAQHQIVAVYEPGQNTTSHFVASSLVASGDKGNTDIRLFDISLLPDGSIRHSSLGSLGLDQYQIMSYCLVSPKEGATGVDGLGVIWNQHEQENTDDETLDAIPYNRTYVARINRRGDYIYLSHAAQALSFGDETSVADMTAYMDFDESRSCPTVTAAFCVGETQVDGASTSAEIIEKVVSLNNEIEWLEDKSGLSNIIDRINGTEIKLAVRNIGLHTIRRFKVEMAGKTFDIPANLAPSASISLTVKLPSKTDFSGEIPFTITADFFDIDITDPSDAGRHTDFASVEGRFKVNVVDFCTGLTTSRLDKETKRDVVVISVANLSPMALKAGNSVKVSLFTDALGDTQYPGVATYTIPASQLFDASTGRPLVKNVAFFVNAPEVRTTAYAICQTVDQDGNVVFDQNSSNNMVMVSLAPRNFGSGDGGQQEQSYTIGKLARLIDALKKNAANPSQNHTTPDQDYNDDGLVTLDDISALIALIAEGTPDHLSISDIQNPQLKVRNSGKSIIVEGLNPEKDVKVFDSTGRLLKWVEPAAKTATLQVDAKGTLIIVNDGKAGVIRH